MVLEKFAFIPNPTWRLNPKIIKNNFRTPRFHHIKPYPITLSILYKNFYKCSYSSVCMHVYSMCISMCIAIIWRSSQAIAPERHGEFLFYFLISLRIPIPTSLQNFKAVKRFLIFQDLQTNKQSHKVSDRQLNFIL